MYELASVEVPSAVVTATLTAPADSAGAIAVIWLALFTTKLVALTPLKVT